MKHSFAHDLKVIRKQSGLSQRDLAHLLGVDQGRVCLLEKGERLPSLRQVCQLSLIFGKAPESLLAGTFAYSAKVLANRLSDMPRRTRRFCGLANRQRTLNALAARLEMSNDNKSGGQV